MTKIADELRAAIERAGRDGVTRYQLSKKTGIAQSQLSRFVHGQIGITLETATIIADGLGLELTLKRCRARKGR